MTAICAALILLGGCSTFERDWKAAGLAEVDVPPPGPEGRWDGAWTSDVSGHTGRLRCIIEADENGQLHANYHATYATGITFEYDMPMEVRQEGDVYHFSAEANLGFLAGGVYTYEGTVEGDAFRSTYSSKRDNGIFEMTRVSEDDVETESEAEESD